MNWDTFGGTFGDYTFKRTNIINYLLLNKPYSFLMIELLNLYSNAMFPVKEYNNFASAKNQYEGLYKIQLQTFNTEKLTIIHTL